jgi:hypothetical protein
MPQFAEKDFDDDEPKLDRAELDEPTPGSSQMAQHHDESAGFKTPSGRTEAPESSHSWHYAPDQ